MHWLDRWTRRIRRLWSALRRRLLGLLPLFDRLGWRRRTEPDWQPDGTAPGRSYLDRFVRAPEAADHPVLDSLRRKATQELFDWLGLVLVPQQAWAILEKVGDPGAAVEQLVRALGCDPLRVRRREPRELARFGAALDVLIDIDALRPYLAAKDLGEIEYLLFAGDYRAVAAYGRVAAALTALAIGRDRALRLRRFAAYEAFLRAAEVYLHEPARLAPKEADALRRRSDRLVTAMEDYTAWREEIGTSLAMVGSYWPGSAAEARDPGQRDAILGAVEDIDSRLSGDPALDPGQIDELLETGARLLEACRALFEELQPAARFGGEEPAEQVPLSETDEALVFFGFAAGASPSWKEIETAFKKAIKAVHPDLAPPNADASERTRREELTKQANRHRDLLRRRHPEAR